ncbi:PucR family transcriptional regulator [Nocardiopsis sp. EMB25]|uniref:PucR family transcriptional regulator n=1 Tax=Nocardiopsis sp. EMB25 TaxID=2835867 RepID=UPI00228509FC|nr:PucR family transcriptional regulator [Nocardiopsis sp. EMB25]MCY9783212.1 PucR family transcriptional regulator [Nocardiopsis sp. EMB25]
MTITPRDITADPVLEVRAVAGHRGLDRPIRWAHVTELHDPVRWLRGGELVLTAGMGFGTTPDQRRAYLHRLHRAGCVALAVAVDTRNHGAPPEILAEGDRLGLPVLQVEGDTPFIAVVETVAEHHAAERTREQDRVLAAQDAMARAALRTGPSGVLTELAAATHGHTLLLDRNGMTTAAVPRTEPPWHARVRASALDRARRPRGMTVLADGEASILLQSLGTTGRALGWLALRSPTPVSPHTRMLANDAASLLAVDLLHSRQTRRIRHHERAPLLRAALTGAPGPRPDLLTLPDPPWEVVYLPSAEPETLADRAADALVDVLGDTDAAHRAGLCTVGGAVAAVLPRTPRPRHGERLWSALRDPSNGPHGAGACGARGPADLPSALDRARQAATEGYRHVDDTGAWELLRSAVPPEGAHAFEQAVLGALRDHDARHGTELVHTLRHYLDQGAQVEATARELGVHRNTLRARLRVAERVLGRGLAEARTRLELWTALNLEPMPCHDGTWHT